MRRAVALRPYEARFHFALGAVCYSRASAISPCGIYRGSRSEARLASRAGADGKVRKIVTQERQ